MITPERRKQPQAMPKRAQRKVLFEETKQGGVRVIFHKKLKVGSFLEERVNKN
jgi:hypothetical protein